MKHLLLLVVTTALTACGLPKDPNGTLQTVQGGELRAGLVAGQPYAEADRARLQRLADSLGATLSVREADAHFLMKELKEGRLHLVASVPRNTPFKHAGFTHPAGPKPPDQAKPPVWAVPPGENAFLLAVNSFLMDEGSSS